MENNYKKYEFEVEGMHCASCVILIEDEIGNLPNVKNAKSILKSNKLLIEANFGEKSEGEIAEELTGLIKEKGYKVIAERGSPGESKSKQRKDLITALPIAIASIALFVFLQKIGLVNMVNITEVNLSTAFLIGLIASVSSCMAVVGGIVLSMSASFAKEGDKVKPQILFHVGRLVSFFLLGGSIGVLGSLFSLSTSWQFGLNLIIALAMLILGINLLDVFHFTKRLQPSMPKFISKRAFGVSKLNHSLTPLLVGIITFFLPCGFTQSMQLYTLQTGSFMEGGVVMLAFSLGTLPVLALISFGALGVRNHKNMGIFLKTAGMVVIAFSLFNFINSLAIIGVIKPVFNL